jgi:hypothetical protein
MTRRAHPAPTPDPTRDETIRALLDDDRDEADEVGRNKPDEPNRRKTPRASPREQAAAPINIKKVDE